MTDISLTVSVITISFRDQQGLEKTVKSVRGQTWSQIEHVIVDGGSEDGTVEYLTNLHPAPIWSSKPDNGRYDAMNKGIERASGKLLIFMNSADTFHDERSVEIIVAQYLRSRFDWAYGLSNVVKDGVSTAIVGRVPFNHARFVLGGNVIPHQAAVFEASFLSRIGHYNENFGLTADQELMVRASMASEPSVIVDVLCNFDATGAGSTRSARRHYRDASRARKINGVVVSGTPLGDSILTTLLLMGTILQRKVRGLTRRMRPERRGWPS